MPLNLETYTRLWQGSVGPDWVGQAILSEIRQSLKDHSTGTTLIVSCVRNSDMVLITADSPKPSPCRPISQSQLSSDSSPNTLPLSPLIYVGTDGSWINYSVLDTLLLLMDANGGFLDDVMIHLRKGK